MDGGGGDPGRVRRLSSADPRDPGRRSRRCPELRPALPGVGERAPHRQAHAVDDGRRRPHRARADFRVRTPSSGLRCRGVELRAHVVEPALLPLLLRPGGAVPRHRRPGRTLGRGGLAERRRRRRPAGRQRVLAHALRSGLLRRAARGVRCLHHHAPVVRKPRARADSGRICADRARHRRARARARPGLVGGRDVRAPATVLACLLLLSACSRGRAEMMPAFALVDQAGAVVKSESLLGRAVVVSFVFTTCAETCPLVTAQLARTQSRVRAEKLDDRVRFVSITLDPMTDRPEVLRRYADVYGIDLATWHFLTGASDDVGRVVRAFGLGAVARERIVHGSLVVLVDRQGRIAERRTDLELDSERLVVSLRKLLG
ncbi:MAG: hypothetical protein DME00_09535 [Candidatus Rokuibacteriota bacterium]|nr:MAG: hypothetical protein DME00_09535 [Candidatus Rokubacteria bacterium]